MSNRIKLKPKPPESREEMETLVGQIAGLKIQEHFLKVRMDEELKRVRAGYEEGLAQNLSAMEPLVARALAWAEAHPAEFKGAKSLEMLHGTVGWRLDNPSLKTISGWTWDRVLEKIKGMANLLQYVRTKEEVNKQALIADREGMGPDMLRLIGVKVVQEETFFVEPKLTRSEAREVAS